MSERLSSGWISRDYIPEQPSEIEIKTAKEKANKYLLKNRYFLGTCACCKTQYGTASDVCSIIDNGLCGWCNTYFRGKVSYVIERRPPIIDEVIAYAKIIVNKSYLKDEERLSKCETKILLDYMKEKGILN